MSLRAAQSRDETFHLSCGMIMEAIISAPVAAWLSPEWQRTRSEIRQRGVTSGARRQAVRRPIEQIRNRSASSRRKPADQSRVVEDALREGRSIAARALGQEPDSEL